MVWLHLILVPCQQETQISSIGDINCVVRVHHSLKQHHPHGNFSRMMRSGFLTTLELVIPGHHHDQPCGIAVMLKDCHYFAATSYQGKDCHQDKTLLFHLLILDSNFQCSNSHQPMCKFHVRAQVHPAIAHQICPHLPMSKSLYHTSTQFSIHPDTHCHLPIHTLQILLGPLASKTPHRHHHLHKFFGHVHASHSSSNDLYKMCLQYSH